MPVTDPPPVASGRRPGPRPVIEVQSLTKSYAGRTVVDGVSFAVEEGEIFGIHGPNGAGKTTTVECIAGRRVPYAGRIRVAGLDPATEHEAVTRILGAQLQESELQPKLTVREALELYAAFYPSPADWHPLAERLTPPCRRHFRPPSASGPPGRRCLRSSRSPARPSPCTRRSRPPC